MIQLTNSEKKSLNNISQVRKPLLFLGNVLADLISVSPEAGTPVNAVAATATLNVTGVVVDSETISIGTKKYEFVTDAAKSKTLPANIAVDIAVNTVKAFNTLTLPTQPTSGDTMWIGTKIYTFVPNGTANAEGEVSIGTDLATAKANIVAAINGTDGHNAPSIEVSASAFVANVCTITALIGGVIGDAIPTTETFTAVGNVFSGISLATGADCTAANAIIALVAAITANSTLGVTAVDGAGDTVVLSANGITGNGIAIAKTMANANFTGGAATLSGGVNGTLAVGTKVMIDATYLYICLNGNALNETNWRRISLGVAY